MGELQVRYPDGFWDEASEYLSDCYLLQDNDDYLEFLVNKVWGLKESCRLIESGCGAGKMGMKLLPLLPPGSTYTGIDQSTALIAKARQAWARAPFQAEFQEGSLYKTPFPNTLDILWFEGDNLIRYSRLTEWKGTPSGR
jgi:SAM-dependent methyltransferase